MAPKMSRRRFSCRCGIASSSCAPPSFVDGAGSGESGISKRSSTSGTGACVIVMSPHRRPPGTAPVGLSGLKLSEGAARSTGGQEHETRHQQGQDQDAEQRKGPAVGWELSERGEAQGGGARPSRSRHRRPFRPSTRRRHSPSARLNKAELANSSGVMPPNSDAVFEEPAPDGVPAVDVVFEPGAAAAGVHAGARGSDLGDGGLRLGGERARQRGHPGRQILLALARRGRPATRSTPFGPPCSAVQSALRSGWAGAMAYSTYVSG